MRARLAFAALAIGLVLAGDALGATRVGPRRLFFMQQHIVGNAGPPPQTGALLLVAGGANNVLLVDGLSNLCLTGSVSC